MLLYFVTHSTFKNAEATFAYITLPTTYRCFILAHILPLGMPGLCLHISHYLQECRTLTILFWHTFYFGNSRIMFAHFTLPMGAWNSDHFILAHIIPSGMLRLCLHFSHYLQE